MFTTGHTTLFSGGRTAVRPYCEHADFQHIYKSKPLLDSQVAGDLEGFVVAGMVQEDFVAQVGCVDVEIDFGGSYGFVAEHHLY